METVLRLCLLSGKSEETFTSTQTDVTVDTKIGWIWCLTGMSEETRTKTGAGLLPTEACAENY